MKEWILKNDNQAVIFGHTHRPRFPISTALNINTSNKDPKNLNDNKTSIEKTPMFNTGSCIHPESIISIEIENGKISMVKWQDDGDSQRTIKVVLEGPVDLEVYW